MAKVTLDQLIELAQAVRRVYQPSSPEGRIVHGVIDLLGESLPCGYFPPVVHGTGRIDLSETWLIVAEPSEARALAAALLRAADVAEARRG